MISYRKTTREEFELVARTAIKAYAEEPLYPTDNMVTLRRGDTILGVFSLSVVWGSVLVIAAVLTEAIYDNPIALVRYLERQLQGYAKRGFHRVQIDVRVGYEAGHKMARVLKFKQEGTMKNYGPNGEDHILYARTSWHSP